MNSGRLYWIPLRNLKGFLYTLPITEPNSSPSRIIRWGEEKWMNFSKAAPQTFRGYIYRLGSHLIGRIPIVETLLWRVHGRMSKSNEKVILYTTLHLNQSCGPLINENTPNQSPNQSPYQLLHQFLSQRIRYHRRWKWINAVLIPPVVILTVLPLVKLVLAWIFFRMIGHARAQSASAWLGELLGKGLLELQPDPQLDAHLKDPSNDISKSELSKIYQKLNKVAIEQKE